MERIYFYKMTTDNGGAPHVSDKLLSLAICKPMIRSTAKPGNLILGFAANSMNADNGLIYVAQVSEKLGGDEEFHSLLDDLLVARLVPRQAVGFERCLEVRILRAGDRVALVRRR